jgi:hypothetical protein
MLSKLNIRKIIFIILIIFYSVQLVKAETYTVSPTGSNSDQNVINEALTKAAKDGGGVVYLKADGTNNVFLVTDSIVISSSNIILVGDSNVIVRVSPSASQYFTGMKGIIYTSWPVDNILIEGFQIDGNCDELPVSYSRSAPQYDHDAEAAIRINGQKSSFSNNIIVRNMKIYDCFSDGLNIRFANNVFAYNNFMSNCQHEGIFFTSIVNGEIFNNKIAGITSDNIRCDNCVNNKVHKNALVSYRGSNSNGAYQGGQNGIQVANAGSSHGYNAIDKPTTTTNVEVFDNILANDMLNAVWVHSIDESQVYLHDNILIDGSKLVDIGIPIGGIDFTHMPTKETSEKIFSSIFDIFNVEFTDTGITNQTDKSINYTVQTTDMGQITGGIKIVGFKDQIVLDNKTYIQNENSTLFKYAVFPNPLYALTGTQLSKNIEVSINNGTANAALTVEMKYSKSKTDPITRNTTRVTKTAHATFTDSHQAPDILPEEHISKAYVTVFSDTKNPIAKVRLNQTDTTQRIEYTYGENTTTHKFMFGERITDNLGIQSTVYSRCDMWEGVIPHMGNELLLIGIFDPAKLNIKCYTPYESYEIKNIEIEYHKNKGESWLITTLKFIVQVLFAMFAGYKIMITIIN